MFQLKCLSLALVMEVKGTIKYLKRLKLCIKQELVYTAAASETKKKININKW